MWIIFLVIFSQLMILHHCRNHSGRFNRYSTPQRATFISWWHYWTVAVLIRYKRHWVYSRIKTCANEKIKIKNYQAAACLFSKIYFFVFCCLLSGLYWLTERLVLWWDGGIALPVPVLFPLCSGLHCYPLLSAWCLEELPQVRECEYMCLCLGIFALHHCLIEKGFGTYFFSCNNTQC